MKAAEALLSKVEPKITELETIMSKSSVELVAGGIKNPVNDFLAKFTTYAGSARRVIKDGRARQPLPDLNEVMREIPQATNAKTFLQQMLAALAKAGPETATRRREVRYSSDELERILRKRISHSK